MIKISQQKVKPCTAVRIEYVLMSLCINRGGHGDMPNMYTYSVELTLLAFSVLQLSCLQITFISLSPASELHACNRAFVTLGF